MIGRLRLFVLVAGCWSFAAGVAFAENEYYAQKAAVPNQTAAGQGAGHSCATGKSAAMNKAEEEAKAKAIENAVAKCTATNESCNTQCANHGALDGKRSSQLLDMTLPKPTYWHEGKDCGWDAQVQVVGQCACTCHYPSK